ncbi:MAG: DUF1801 domain-containing protein [Acidimicrobiales bacterium]
MVRSDATTVEAYLDELAPDRREAVETVRGVILANLQPGFEEGMQYGMIGYYVPLSRYPVTYNGEALTLAGLASQKRHLALYLMGPYVDDDEQARFREQWEATGKRLDMGKSCIRFRRLDDVPLDVVGGAIARASVDAYIDAYERARGTTA